MATLKTIPGKVEICHCSLWISKGLTCACFSLSIGAKGVALILGTGVGGLLAQPALNYPDTFSATGFWAKYEAGITITCFELLRQDPYADLLQLLLEKSSDHHATAILALPSIGFVSSAPDAGAMSCRIHCFERFMFSPYSYVVYCISKIELVWSTVQSLLEYLCFVCSTFVAPSICRQVPFRSSECSRGMLRPFRVAVRDLLYTGNEEK